jgi:alkylation response protein AidB-like acyl-CoA dehydrogenase
MTTSQHYKSNLRDVLFNLFEVHELDKNVLGKGPFSHLDAATIKDTLAVVEVLAREQLASSFVEGDRTPLKHDEKTGNVTLPEGVAKSLKAWFDGGWHLLEIPERNGGIGAPPSVAWAAMEFYAGANPTTTFYGFGPLMSRIIDALGTDSQKKRYVINMLERHWGATMQLSEPQAGSDVGEGSTKAKHIEGDLWHLEGTKCWITNGDFNATENIVHLVLARPEGAGGGTKGLSLFIVPKFWVNEDGTLGERNGMKAVSIEKKMGIKGSATCVMELGGDVPCKGLLMGEVHDGIRQMFKVIENARMSIGIKSMSTLSTAYLNALAYAKERVQGGDMLKIMDKSSPRVRIITHPDVRRMLMEQKAFAEGMRALVNYTAAVQDQIDVKGGHHTADTRDLDKLNDFLLPLIKGYNSEKAYVLLGQALQVFGGAGYTQDWPMEQYIRDQKIDTLYEGTTHIQALDLVFRKIARDNGQTVMALAGEIQQFVEGNGGGDALKAEKEMLGKALGQLQGIFGIMLPRMGESLYHVGLHANRMLFAVSEVVIGWLLLKHAVVALKKLPEASNEDKSFYEGKVASARFYSREVLPNIALYKKVIEGSDLSLMDVPEEAF